MISETTYVNAGAGGTADVADAERLEGLAAVVVTRLEAWIVGGLAHDVALALVQNALPLAEAAPALDRVQRCSHARVLVTLLALVDDAAATDLATAMVEVLPAVRRQEPVLAS